MLVLLVTVPTAPAVSAIAAAVAVELLVRTTTIFTARIAVAVAVMVVAMIALVLRALVVLPVLALWGRLRGVLFAWLRWGFRCGGRRRRRRRCRGCVLDGDEAPRWGPRVVVVATVIGRFGCPVEVRVWLASRFGGRTAVRARPAAATLRASAFGHAAVFVMGCVLTMALRTTCPGCLAVLLLIKRSHETATRAHEGHELMHVGCGLAYCLETGFGIVRASHERFCRRTSADHTRGQATFPSSSVRLMDASPKPSETTQYPSLLPLTPDLVVPASATSIAA
jgi:hypothetical protein